MSSDPHELGKTAERDAWLAFMLSGGCLTAILVLSLLVPRTYVNAELGIMVVGIALLGLGALAGGCFKALIAASQSCLSRRVLVTGGLVYVILTAVIFALKSR